MSESITGTSDIVLHCLMKNDIYTARSLPFIKKEYFESEESSIIFQELESYIKAYSGQPSKSALQIAISERRNVSEKILESSLEKVSSLYDHAEDIDTKWAVDQTEKWCKERAFFNAVVKASNAIDSGKDLGKLGLPEEMQEALAISFDNSIGLDFLEDYERKFNEYHNEQARIPFKIDLMNKITKGGVFTKTLTGFMSNQTGGFKSGTMCDWAAFLLTQGYDVLYITLEMSEERIGHRIDANLMNVPLEQVEEMPKGMYFEKSKQMREKYAGKLIIKEFPTSTAHAGHFRFLLKDLFAKKKFKPKIVFFDYLNLCASSRLTAGNSNTYSYVKAIAEELRGLAIEFDFAGVTATQGNRGAIGNSDVGLDSVSESIGLPATLDLFLAIITTDDLEKMCQLLFKQLKNRYNHVGYFQYFHVGVDKSKMQLYNLDSQPTKSSPVVSGAPTTQTTLQKAEKFQNFKFD